jgi:hypothetical protein
MEAEVLPSVAVVLLYEWYGTHISLIFRRKLRMGERLTKTVHCGKCLLNLNLNYLPSRLRISMGPSLSSPELVIF